MTVHHLCLVREICNPFKLQLIQFREHGIQNILREAKHGSQGLEGHTVCLLYLLVVSKTGKMAIDIVVE